MYGAKQQGVGSYRSREMLMKSKFWLLVMVASLFLTLLAPMSASAAGYFTDDDGNIHEANIDKIAALGITQGCNQAGTL